MVDLKFRDPFFCWRYSCVLRQCFLWLAEGWTEGKEENDNLKINANFVPGLAACSSASFWILDFEDFDVVLIHYLLLFVVTAKNLCPRQLFLRK